MRVTRGASPRPINDWIAPEGTPWVKISDATASSARVITSTREFIRNEGRTRSVVVYPGDLIVSNSATPGIPRFMGIEACIHDGWLLLRDLRGIDPLYMYYTVENDRPLLLEQGNGSIFTNLKTEILKRHLIAVPPLAEQQAIAEVLGALDDKIAANTALAATAERVLRAEIDAAWLRGDDRSSVFSDWVDLNPKVSVPRSDSAIYIDMKRLPETGWSIDGFDLREPKGGARFQNGDTLLARITPCLENRKAGFVDHLGEGDVGIGSTEFIVLRARGEVAAPIPFLLATAPRFRDHAIQHMVGTSGRQRVAASDLATFELPTPDRTWLADFGARASALFCAVAAQSVENRTLAATRDALLPQLMSGQLRVRDAEDAASALGV